MTDWTYFDDEKDPIWAEVPLAYGWRVSSVGDLVDPQGVVVRTPEDGPSKGDVRISEYYASYNCSMDLLLTITFFKNYDKRYVISHIDGDPYNTSVQNLQFFGRETRERIYCREWGRKLFLDKRLKGRVQIIETGDIYESANAAAKAVGGQSVHVYACLKGERRTHKGHSFRYVE